MNIDFTKLNRLEEAARQQHAVLRDIEDRLNETRATFQRARSTLEINLDGQPRGPLKDVLRDWLDRGCRFPVPSLPNEQTPAGRRPDGTIDLGDRPNPWRPHLERLADLRDRVDSLEAERARAYGRWQELNAPLDRLRQFVREYGRKPQTTSVRLANEAVAPVAVPTMEAALGRAAAQSPSVAASSPPTGMLARLFGKGG